MESIVSIGGRDWPIKPTPIAKMLKLLPLIAGAQMSGGMPIADEATALALCEAIYHGIRRAGGPDVGITLDFVSDNIDATNIEAVMAVFVAVNDLEKKAAGQGEVGAGAAS